VHLYFGSVGMDLMVVLHLVRTLSLVLL